MSAAPYGPRLVKKMDLAVWTEIRQWGQDKGLEMAEAIALLWELQQGRDQLGKGCSAMVDGLLPGVGSAQRASAGAE